MKHHTHDDLWRGDRLVARKPLTTHQLINETRPCRWFASDYSAAT